MDYIRKSLNVMESVSCLKFINRTTEEDYIEVTVNWIEDMRGLKFTVLFCFIFSRGTTMGVIHTWEDKVASKC
jgi:hypothetical protein